MGDIDPEKPHRATLISEFPKYALQYTHPRVFSTFDWDQQ